MKTGYFFDMDGTLYNNKFHTISTKTFNALEKLKKDGNLVFLATSRCLKELDNLPRAMFNFKFDARILDGGSYILDIDNNTIEHDPIDYELMKKIDTYCKENQLVYRYSTKDGNYFGTKPDQAFYELEYSLYLNAPTYKEFDHDEALNVLVCIKNEEQDKAIRTMAENCGIVAYPECLELRANNRDKASAIKTISEKYKLDRIICFGDGSNDIEMLKLADIGIAMGNACDKLKKIADSVIGNVDEDGIYHYLIEQNLVKED